MSFTIGITTFSKRFDYLENLISQIRSFVNNPIIITVNGEKDGKTNDDYLKKVLNLCQTYDQIYPTFFLETRGLSKMWNTIIVNSFNDHILILNDDIEIKSEEIFNTSQQILNDINFQGITKINSSFSHFLVDKKVIEELSFFDERLLGFGEEDGDITYRMLKLNRTIGNVFIPGVINIVSEIRHDHIKSGIGKYSKFNRDFIYNEKYKVDPNGIKGMFDSPMIESFESPSQYPYEVFYRENKSNL